MKKIIFLSLFISFKMFGQNPKMEVIVPNFGETDGIVGVLKTTSPNYPYSAVKGRNYSSTAIGWGVYGTHDGYGTGVGGFALGGAGVTGNSTSGVGGRFSSTSGFALITGTGRVGIGLSNPNELLDVNGRMRIRHNGSTAGLWMSNSTNGLSDADGAFFGMENDNKAGIWINNAWRFGVNNAGEISTTSMVGSGYRMVLASPNGVLLSNFQPQVWSISASAFTPTTTGSAQFFKSTTSAYFSSGSFIMVAPVNLPTGVNVTEVVVFYSNTDPTNTLRVDLSALVLANNSSGIINTPQIAAGILGTVTGIQSATLSLSPGEVSINNANRAYYLRVSSNVWSNNMAIYGIKITYSY